MFIQTKVFNLLSKKQLGAHGIKLSSENFHKKMYFTRWSPPAARSPPDVSQTHKPGARTARMPPPAHSSAPSLHAAYCCSATLAVKAVTLRGDIWGRARVTCPTGARYFLEGMRSGKVEWVNVAQSHREDSRTSSLSQLGSNNFIKILLGAQSKFFLPSTAAVRLSVRTWWERADSEKKSPGFHSTRVRGLHLARIHARGNRRRVTQKQEQGVCKSSSFPSQEISVNAFSHRKLGGWGNPLTCTEVPIRTASQLFSALPTATFHPGLCRTKSSWAN